ncbi:hypothetical protein P8C59_005586 [Phyllachora maydis]|uniref:Uncharacterized protein n=1 Tax=Phyllachora maydis TaxID=1825666 RepID=A0AAD9I6E8_9PEZI|nr:hypothetical protein P8C59_005586 [Phyllachora maydis]
MESRLRSLFADDAGRQAYSQAIKYATLPACNRTAEAILRLHHQRSKGGDNFLLDGLNGSSLGLDEAEESSGEFAARTKRKHKRSASSSAYSFEWTTKIYVLITAGCVLQYAGDGPFDRFPEKILALSKNSAAYASDLIPGRHWVLHVSSVADEDPASSTSASSLLSRLQFRAGDKRHAAQFLMVQHLRVESLSKAVMQRRSMPQLAEGPPPAPPPTCALPPIPPRKFSEDKSLRRPAGIFI